MSTPGFDFSGRLIVDRDTDKAVGVRVETDAETTEWFDARRKALQQAVDARLPGHVNRITCRRCDRPEAVVLVHSWSDQDPGKYCIYRPEGERWPHTS